MDVKQANPLDQRKPDGWTRADLGGLKETWLALPFLYCKTSGYAELTNLNCDVPRGLNISQNHGQRRMFVAR
jgi:hypothetical protein